MTSPNNYAFASEHTSGLTKREYFAAMAMQGILSANPEWSSSQAYRIAKEALECADALVVALNKQPDPDPDQY